MVDIVTNASAGTITGSGGAAIDLSGAATTTNITALVGADGTEAGDAGDSITISAGSGFSSSANCPRCSSFG